MCQDGGLIWECDTPGCERAVCDQCIRVPPDELYKLQLPDVMFKCVSCHWDWGKGSGNKEPYVVSVFYVSFHVRAKMYLIFFYRALQYVASQF